MPEAGPLVLIAEDDEAILELVSTCLQLAGYRTVAARLARTRLSSAGL